jgi:hypothetical protein
VFDVHDTAVEISGLTITHGNANDAFPPGPSGGGILNRDGDLTLVNVNLEDNDAWFGGGISSTGTLEMERSAIIGNSATGIGSSGTTTLTNVTISGNSGQGFPDTSHVGGISVRGEATLINVTIADNVGIADSFIGLPNAGGIHIDGEATLKNVILANNANGNCGGDAPISSGHNLEDANTCSFAAGGDLVNTDPLLGPLDYYTGLTRVHNLLPNSPAINAGSPDCPPPNSDQRGFPRPQGPACDIGAYESKVIVLAIEGQIGDCLDEIDIVWGHDNTTKEWQAFEPGAPMDIQTLHVFSAGRGYFIHANDHCTIASYPNERPVSPGWNLIGWVCLPEQCAFRP